MPRLPHRFTLLQLLVAVAGIGIALAGAAFAVRESKHVSPVSVSAISPNTGTWVMGRWNGRIEFADLHTARRAPGHLQYPGTITAIAISPDGTRLAAGGESGSVHAWDLRPKRLRWARHGHTETVEAAAFSPDGRFLATGGIDGKVVLWDWSSGMEIDTANYGREVRAVRFAPDGGTLATLERFGAMWFWDIATGRKKSPSPIPLATINCFAFAPDGNSLATADRSGITLWDLQTAKPKQKLAAGGGVAKLVFSPDATMLAAGEYYSVPAPVRIHTRLRLA